MRTMRDEAIEEEARRRKAAQPVTWQDVLGMASIPCVYGGIGFSLVLLQTAHWSSWPVLLCFLFAVGGACLTWAMYRALGRGWTLGQADPFVKVGCWFFAVPIVVSIVVSLGECSIALIAQTPAWALITIAVLIAILVKR